MLRFDRKQQNSVKQLFFIGKKEEEEEEEEESACNAGDLGSILRSGKSPGEGNVNPLQCPCLENPVKRGAWRVTVYGVARVGHG